MDQNYKEVLAAVNKLRLDVRELKTELEKSVAGQFKDHNRRLSALESNQRWLALAVLGAVITNIMKLIIK